MEYKDTYADLAKQILSKPFKSKQHVCETLGITLSVFENWIAEIKSFETAVAEGFLKGEVKTRNWLAKAALSNSKEIDLKIFMGLAKDIYGIGNNEETADNIEPVKWRIEFVGSESKDTGQVTEIPYNK